MPPKWTSRPRFFRFTRRVAVEMFVDLLNGQSATLPATSRDHLRDIIFFKASVLLRTEVKDTELFRKYFGCHVDSAVDLLQELQVADDDAEALKKLRIDTFLLMLFTFHCNMGREMTSFALGIDPGTLDKIWEVSEILGRTLPELSFDDRFDPAEGVEIPRKALKDLGQLKKIPAGASSVYVRSVGDGVDVWVSTPTTKGVRPLLDRYGKKGRSAIRFVLLVHVKTGIPVGLSEVTLGRTSEIRLFQDMGLVQQLEPTERIMFDGLSRGVEGCVAPAMALRRHEIRYLRSHPKILVKRGKKLILLSRRKAQNHFTFSSYRILVENVIGRFKMMYPVLRFWPFDEGRLPSVVKVLVRLLKHDLREDRHPMRTATKENRPFFDSILERGEVSSSSSSSCSSDDDSMSVDEDSAA